jgi:tetratricopeptide (TPR) repeat protein
MGPFETNPPAVARGLKAYDEGRYEDALREFNAAEREAPRSPALEYNRGNTLYRLRRYDEAKDAYRRAAENADASLRERDLYNMGNTLADMGDTQGAIDAYRKALVLEPHDEAARHNLEVLLRNLPPPKSETGDGGGDGGRPDGGPQDGGQDGGRGDGGSDGGQGDGGQRGDGGTPRGDGGSGDAGSGAGDAGTGDAGQQGTPSKAQGAGEDGGAPLQPDAGVPEAEQLRDAGVGSSARFDRNDAERLLDAMKQNERNLQLWRFQQKKKTRKPDAKDW